MSSPSIVDRLLLQGRPWPAGAVLATRGPLVGEHMAGDDGAGGFRYPLQVDPRTGDHAPAVYRSWLWRRISGGDELLLGALREIVPASTLLCVGCDRRRCHSRLILAAWEHLRAQGELPTPPRAASVVNMRAAPFDVYIGRNNAGTVAPVLALLPAAEMGELGCYGNPFTVQEHGAAALDLFRAWFLDQVETVPLYRAAVEALRGYRLGCFCKPGPCHGDIIVDWLDSSGLNAQNT